MIHYIRVVGNKILIQAVAHWSIDSIQSFALSLEFTDIGNVTSHLLKFSLMSCLNNSMLLNTRSQDKCVAFFPNVFIR